MEENQIFDKLRAKREQWIRSSKENNFDFDSILAGAYSDPSHFIYEILQNAEDARATKISFNLFNDHLEIKHNGKDFNFDDVEGITGIGMSTKKGEINSIGKFGVGFKSVFAITLTPEIHSGHFHFKIENFVVPSRIGNNGIEGTLIVLPFNHPSRSKDKIFEIVRKKLENIGLKTLLFLRKMEEIKWQTPHNSGYYRKKSNELQNLDNVHRVSIISEENGKKKNPGKFLVIKKPIKIENHDLNVEVAYRIENDESEKEIIIKEKDSKLVVFFPTEKVTYLNFLIQAPYKTTPNRENIPLDDEQNKRLIEETANLVADSIPIIKKLGFLTVSFLEVLPIDRNHKDEIIYSSIFKKVKEKLLSDKALLPTSKQNFTIAQDALLARGKELAELLGETDINVLFRKSHWLDTNITHDRTRQLHDYLTDELNIKEINFEDFASSITKEFMEQKTDDWIIKFYSSLLDKRKRSLWEKITYYYSGNSGILRRKPIIRLSDNTHIAPFDKDDKIQVYLPSETKLEYKKTVKESLTQNKKSLEFLTKLGLSKPDIFDEIKTFVVQKYKDPHPDIEIEKYFDDFEKLLIAFQEKNLDEEKETIKKEIIDKLKGLYIIYSTNSITGENRFCKPSETYLKTNDLIEYFKGFDRPVFFVSDELTQRFSKYDNVLNKLLLTIGCEDKPRRIKIKPTLTDREKSELRKKSQCNHLTREICTKDYDYEGLDNFLSKLSKERSNLLWHFLLKSLDSCCNRGTKDDFFKSEYSWFYRSQRSIKFEAKFLTMLKKTAWLVDKNGNFVLPNQISLSELPDSYTKNDENIKILTEALGFQIDEIKRVEEKYGGKFIPENEKDEYEEFKRLKKEQSEKETKAKTEDESWIPEVEPETVEATVKEISPETIDTPDLRDQRPSECKIGTIDDKSDVTDKDKANIGKSQKQLKDIGKWGERFVYNYLQKQYVNQNHVKINWLNENSDVGKGYDFSIVSDGKEIEYIEVKSKMDSNPQLIEITGTQWEFARKLYKENKGDKYKIYVVSNAGNENAKIGIIKNPSKLWKEGKLYAHPVNFKL